MNSPSQKTIIAATSVLASLAVIQLAVVFTIFIQRASLVGNFSPAPPVIATAPASPLPTVVSVATPAAFPVAEPETQASATPDITGKKTAQVPKSGAKPEVQENTAAPLSEKDKILVQARRARDNGDMTAALAGFRQAQKVAPDDPLVISELATTYEAMGLKDKAITQWRRVFAAGEKAGDLYAVAAEKLRTGVDVPDSTMGRDSEGLQPGTTMGLADTQKIYEETPAGEAKVTLRVGVKSRSSSTVVQGDVNVQVMFYELVNNHEVEKTDAAYSDVTSEWITAPADWRGDNMEVLRVIYQQKGASPADPDGIDPDKRKYLGYIATVYYKNELQDISAEPVKLLQYFPPKPTLNSNNEIPQ